MATFKQLFMYYLDSQGVKYTDKDDDAVLITYSGDNMKSIPVYVFFDRDGDPLVQFRCWDIANFKDKIAEGIVTCNSLNAKYRWVKFYLDEDQDIICECDAYVDQGTCGAECLALVRRLVNITDEAYPEFMRALYA